MAGHSHWSQIKRKKAVNDAKRGKLWSKLARNITVAVRANGPNPADNLTLRYMIEKAKAVNMPGNTIERAINRASGDGANYTDQTYEGYGPGGVAVLINALTDNPSRTAPELRLLFDKGGGNLGSTNCVAWQFKKKGVILVAAADTTEDALLELVTEAGGEDLHREDDIFAVETDPASFEAVRAALSGADIPVQNAELSMVAENTTAVDAATAERVLKLIDQLEDNDDVQNVYTNMELPEGVQA